MTKFDGAKSQAFVVPVAAFCIAAAGCGAGKDAQPLESASKTAQAVWGGNVDPSNPATDVVVELASTVGCSGTLISPRLVLTAGHCVQSLADVWTVSVGNDRAAARPTRSSVRSWRLAPIGYEFTTHSPGQDLALIALDQPVLDEVRIPRPRFVAGAGPAGFAGYSPYNRDDTPNATSSRYRTAVSLGSLDGFGYGPDDDNGGWHYFLQSDSYGFQHGDSGGPLFLVDPNGDRQLIGVISQAGCRSIGGCDANTEADRFYFAAVTQDTFASQWVVANALESAHPDLVQRSANWYARHHRAPDTMWLGEVDYTGPCIQSSDVDCDHWYDVNDNCPRVPNSGQEDSRDSGMGDACYVPLQVPQNCTSSAILNAVGAVPWIGCDQPITFRCDKDPAYSLAAGDRWTLKRDVGGGNFQALNVQLDEVAPTAPFVSLSSSASNSGVIERYVVCEERLGLELCSDPLLVQTQAQSSCDGPSYGGGGSNVNVDGPTCGLPPLPRCKTITPRSSR